ncbi:MAG: hypothetical protein A2Z25_06790 [Planctomycetes bacterium RBG_16_55_9]|nr:MAG: hypothetical protein A2Z25_06790 [Planctomycetes bacterium RBG_16_55_9]
MPALVGWANAVFAHADPVGLCHNTIESACAIPIPIDVHRDRDTPYGTFFPDTSREAPQRLIMTFVAFFVIASRPESLP